MSTEDKYQLLRQRLIDHFWYGARVAVVVGAGIDGQDVTFGDQTIYMGQALLAFASEIAVFRQRDRKSVV